MEREIIDPEKAKEIIRRNAENAVGWPYREEMKDLNNMAILLKNRLIDPILLTKRVQMPNPIIGFDDAGNRNILAYYNTVHDAYGNPDQIIFNTAHYKIENGVAVFKYPRWTKYEILLHEEAHLHLNFIGKIEERRIPAHGREFCDLLEGWGLHPVPEIGCHAFVADADKPFGILMAELGIQRPDDVPRGEGPIKTDYFRPRKERGRSSLFKWWCPECHVSVNYGRKDDPELIHIPCNAKFVIAERRVK